MGVWAILLAGGTGSRFGEDASKLLAPLAGKSVLWHSARAFGALAEVDGLCVVSHPQWFEAYQDELAQAVPDSTVLWASGGPTRRDSVYNGLSALPTSAHVVMVHDAARPLVRPDRLQAALNPVLQGHVEATSLGRPVPYTIKSVASPEEPWVSHTIPRALLWQVNTPQVFTADLLRKAHQKVPHDPMITDDAELVERLLAGQNAVLMVEDASCNLKITTPEDLVLAHHLLHQRTMAPQT